jgi:hypothetical protein
MIERHTLRLYAFALAILVFFTAWAAVAARPWAPTAAQDPRVAALAAREQRIHRQSLVVRHLVAKRWAVYHVALAARKKQIAAVHAQSVRAAAAAPPVRVVTLPPLTITRTS